MKSIIETKRLMLREFSPDDFEELYAVLADSDIMQHYPYTFDAGRVERWIARNTEPYPVRRLNAKEIQDACKLMWKVFLQFEAPEYSQEGIDHFRRSLEDQERIRKLTFYGAFDGDKLVGTLCMRALQHIGGFFVDAAYHRRGIGRRLFEAMRQDYARQVFTVNSSPYAVEIYRHLGFSPTGGEQTVDGLCFTPMQYSAQAEEAAK